MISNNNFLINTLADLATQNNCNVSQVEVVADNHAGHGNNRLVDVSRIQAPTSRWVSQPITKDNALTAPNLPTRWESDI